MAPCTLSESLLSELSPCPKRMIFRMSYSYGKHDLWMTWTILKSLQILGSPFDSRVRDALKSSQMRWCTSERYGRTTKHTLPPLSPKNSSCFVWCDLKIDFSTQILYVFFEMTCFRQARPSMFWLSLHKSKCPAPKVMGDWTHMAIMNRNGKKGERVLNTHIL